jgi:hypothetical protein
VHDNAQKYRFDATRISSVGSSAGGHLASLLGTRLGTSGKGTTALNAVVAFNPVLDLTDTTCGEDGTVKFLGGKCAEHPAVCKEASPVFQVHPNMPPFLILHGTADENVPFPQAVHMVEAFWSTAQWYAPTEKAMETFLLKVFQPMPVAEQNALAQEYCAVCHQDKPNDFGLSLAGFDAAHPDPTVAAMLAAKLQGGAISAAGIPRPGRATEDALLVGLPSQSLAISGLVYGETAVFPFGNMDRNVRQTLAKCF